MSGLPPVFPGVSSLFIRTNGAQTSEVSDLWLVWFPNWNSQTWVSLRHYLGCIHPHCGPFTLGGPHFFSKRFSRGGPQFFSKHPWGWVGWTEGREGPVWGCCTQAWLVLCFCCCVIQGRSGQLGRVVGMCFMPGGPASPEGMGGSGTNGWPLCVPTDGDPHLLPF